MIRKITRMLQSFINGCGFKDYCEDGTCNLSKGKCDDCYNCPYNFDER